MELIGIASVLKRIFVIFRRARLVT